MTGMASAVRQLDGASARLAKPVPADPVADRVEQITAQHSFAANVATVRTADQMIGTLIDIVA